MIVSNINELEAKHKNENSEYEYYKYEVTEKEKDNSCKVFFYKIPPKKSGYPFHFHAKNEEIFYVISGEAVLKTHSGERNVSSGDVIICNKGEEGAHKFTNISDENFFIYIEVETVNFPEVINYPDTKKIGVFIDEENKSFFKEGTGVSYYE